MQFQSGVFVLVASVTGVLGAGEEVAVDFGLEDGGDEVGGVVVVAALHHRRTRCLAAVVRVAGVDAEVSQARPGRATRTREPFRSTASLGASGAVRVSPPSALFAAAA